MQYDEQDPKQFPSGRKESKNSHSGHSHHQKYDEGNYYPARGKQKTTIITLSLVTCLFMCVIGYEIIRENQSQPEPAPIPPQQAQKERKIPVIVNRSHYNDESLLHNVLEEDDNYDNHQIRVLKEQNKQQATKIRALRQELLDKMQNTHEIKANLFRQEGDPKDKARINELAQQLTDKDQNIRNLSLQINSLEKETADLHKKITQLEVTRDALATMMDNQRASKEHETEALRKKIEELNKAAEDNKSYLAKKVKILEGTQQHLAESLEQKTVSLGQLEKEVGHHKASLSIKKNELQNLYNLFATSEEEIRKDILDLITNIQWEATSKAILEKNLHAQIRNKSSEVQNLQSEVEKHKNLLATASSSLAEQEKLSNEQAMDFIASLEWEVTWAQKKHSDLHDAIHGHTITLQERSTQIEKLQSDLAIHETAVLNDKREFLSYSDLYHFTNEQLQSELEEVLTAYEEEEQKSLTLINELKDIKNKYDSLQKEQENLQRELANHQIKTDEFTQQLTAKEFLIATQQLQLKSLLESHQSNQENSSEEIQTLTKEIEEEETELAELRGELASYVVSYNIEEENRKILLMQLEQVAQQAAQLDETLLFAQQQLKQREDQILILQAQQKESETGNLASLSQLALNWELEKVKSEELQQKLEDHIKQFGGEQSKISELEEQFTKLTQELSNKEAELLQTQDLLHFTAPQLETLSNENQQLHIQIAHSEEIMKNYHDQLALYEMHREDKERLEAHLTELHTQLQNKESDHQAAEIALRETTASLEELKQLSAELSGVKAKAEDFEQKYLSATTQLTEEQNRLQRLEQELTNINSTLRQKEFALDEAQNKLSDTSEKIALLTNENILLGQLKDTTKNFEQKFSETLLEHNKDEAKVKELESQIQYLSTKMEEKNTQLHTLSAENTQFAEDRKKIQDLQEEVAHLSTMLSNKEAELDATQEHIDSSAQRLEVLAAENIHLSEAITKAEEIEQQLRASLNQYKEEAENVSDFHQDRNDLLQRLRDKEELAETTRQNLVDTQERLTALLSDINELHAFKQKSNDLEQKYQEIFTKYNEELAKQIEQDELLEALADKVYEKEQELISADEKFQQTSEQLERLQNAKEQLAQEKMEFENKHHSITADHTESIQQLSEELENAQLALQKALLDFEQHKEEAQRKERKLHAAELRSSLFEEELGHNKATLKSDFEQKLAQISADFESEKNKSQTLNEKLTEVLQSYETEQSRAINLQSSLQETTQIVSDLENKLKQYQSNIGTDSTFGERLQKVEKDFEDSQIVNASLQSELKSLLSQYLTEQERSRQLEHELQSLANKNRQINSEPTYYRLDEEVVELPNHTETYDPERRQQRPPSRLQRMSEFSR